MTKIEEVLHWKPGPTNGDPVGPWLNIIELLDREKQFEAYAVVLEFNKAMLNAQKTLLDAQHVAVEKMTQIVTKQKGVGAAK